MISKEKFQKTIETLYKHILVLLKEINKELAISLKKIECFDEMYDEYVSFCQEIGNSMSDYLEDKSIAESDNTKMLKVEVAKIPLHLRHEALVSSSKSLDEERLSLCLLGAELNDYINKLINLFLLSKNFIANTYNKKESLVIHKIYFKIVYASIGLLDTCKRNIDLIDDDKKVYKTGGLFYIFAENSNIENEEKIKK